MSESILLPRPLVTFVRYFACVLALGVGIPAYGERQLPPVDLPQKMPPNDPRHRIRYEDVSTFKQRKSFTHDPWTWGYSREFAELFKMPEQWIEPQLGEGLLAIAFRMTDIGTTTCGLGGREESCWPALQCQFDLYIDKEAPLPWSHPDRRRFFMPGLSSGFHLVYSDPKLILPSHRGPEAVFPYQVFRQDVKSTARSGRVAYFDRDFQPGIALLSFVGTCPDYDAAGQFLFFDQTFVASPSAEPSYALPVPRSYLSRAHTSMKRDDKPNEQVIERIRRQFLESRRVQPLESQR